MSMYPIMRNQRNRLELVPALIHKPEIDQPVEEADLARSYSAFGHDGVYDATNPEQRFHIQFAPHGIQLATGEKALAWDMTLVGWGCDDQVEPVSPIEPMAIDNRVEYRRDAMTEWYLNTSHGL